MDSGGEGSRKRQCQNGNGGKKVDEHVNGMKRSGAAGTINSLVPETIGKDKLACSSSALGKTQSFSDTADTVLRTILCSVLPQGKENYRLLGEVNELLQVNSKYGEDLGIVKLTATDDRKVYAHKMNDGSTVATGGIDSTNKYLGRLFAKFGPVGSGTQLT